MMLTLYPKLSTRSRRAMMRVRKFNGKPYYYSPRGNLLERLSEETGLNIDQCYHQLMEEREYLLRLNGKK